MVGEQPRTARGPQTGGVDSVFDRQRQTVKWTNRLIVHQCHFRCPGAIQCVVSEGDDGVNLWIDSFASLQVSAHDFNG